MAASVVLYVGVDICHRIPVMEAAGLFVSHSECSADSIREAMLAGAQYSVITFHNDVAPVEPEAIAEARSLTRVPLVLFENPAVATDESEFNVIIGAHTPPQIWLAALQRTIEESRGVGDPSTKFRTECEGVRITSHQLRAAASRNRNSEFDPAAMWQGGGPGFLSEQHSSDAEASEGSESGS